MSVDPRAAYEAWHAGLPVDAETTTPWHQMVKAALQPERDLQGRRVLEIGCGRGGLARWLAAGVGDGRVIAADFSAVAVQMARELAASVGATQIRWQVGDIQALAHPDGCFDTVISCETVEHVPDPAQAIRELARVLRPGGRLFLTTPNYLGTLGLYRVYLRGRGRRYTEGGQPINNLTMLPRTRAWVARAGLHIQRTDAVGHYLPFPGRPPIRFPRLDRPRALTRWFGLHSLVIAEKPPVP